MSRSSILFIPEDRDPSLWSLTCTASTQIRNDPNSVETLGIANVWSLSFWAKNTDAASGTSRYIFETREANDNNNITVGRSQGDSETLWVNNKQSTNQIIIKRFEFDGVWTDGDWRHIVVTFDGPGTMVVYIDGVETEPTTKVKDQSGTMTDPGTRSIGLAQRAQSDNFDWIGQLGHSAMWDVILDQDDVSEIFNPTTGLPFDIDLSANVAGYDKSASLIQWWRPGWTLSDPMENFSSDIDAITFNLTNDVDVLAADAPA